MEFANDYRDFGLIVDPSNPNSKGEVYAICPQCDHLRKKPGEKKVGVNIKKGVWRCNHCDWTGGLTPIEWAKNKPKIDVSDINSLTDKQIAYFKGRGISHRTLLAREVKSKMASIKQKSTGEFKNRLCSVFTFREKGWVMMHKYRDGAKNFKIEKGSKLIPDRKSVV